jgi:hypothetical protein
LVFEYCDLLFKALREQWGCFKEQHKVLLLPGKDRVGAGIDADSGTDKAEEEKRKKLERSKKQKAGPKKYYAVAVGRATAWCLHYLGRSGSFR